MGGVRRTGDSRSRHLMAAAAAVGAVVVVAAGCSVVGQGEQGPSATAASSVSEASATSQVFETLADYEGQVIEWGGCEDFEPPQGATTDGFECGFAQVPLDYDEPAGERVSIAVTRRPARGESIGSLFYNPGGPGASGVDYAFFETLVVRSDVLEQMDLVGFDPRGVSRSEGIDCLSDSDLDAYLSVDLTPDAPAERLEYSDQLAGMAVGCSTQAPLAEQMDTVSVARDLDILRAAMEQPKLNYLGKSYGTQLGSVYAELFPDNVGRMVLDGAVDPELDLASGQGTVEQIGGFEVAARAFVEDCLTRDDCPLSGDVDQGMSQIAEFVDRLDVAPMPTDDEERPLTQGLATYGVFAPLYAVDTWEVLRVGLTEAFDGSASTLLLLADSYSGRAPDGSYLNNSLEAFPAVNCVDLPPRAERVELDVMSAQRELKAAAPVFGRFFDLAYDACEDWPFDGVGTPAIRAVGADPILVIGTTRDPATPYVWAQRLAEALDSGVLLTFDGDGHTAYLTTGSECIDTVVDTFLLEGTVPRVGLRCEAQYD